MRVLITTDAITSVWQYSTTLAQTLADVHGVQVLLTVCGPPPQPAQLNSMVFGVRKGGGSVDIELLDMPLEWMNGPDEAYSEGRQILLQLALKWRAHVVHANEHHIGQIGASGFPVLVVSHGDLSSRQAALGGEPSRTVATAYWRLVTTGLRAASLVVAPGPHIVECLSAWYGYSDVVRVIPHGISAGSVPFQEPRSYTAAMVGRLWDPAKNLQCFRIAASQIEGAFIAVGPQGEQGAEPREPAPDPLSYPGALSNLELRAMLHQTKIFVAPALYQPIGLTIVEAAMAGCCLLLSDIQSHRTLWENAALYFDPLEPEMLRSAMQILLSDVNRMQSMAEHAQKKAIAHYTAERMARAYLTSYQRLALRYGISL